MPEFRVAGIHSRQVLVFKNGVCIVPCCGGAADGVVERLPDGNAEAPAR